MIVNQLLANQSKSENSWEPTNVQRRALMFGGALAALLSTSGRVMAEEENDRGVKNPFILLLKGLYSPVNVGQGPAHNLGLSSVDLSDGSYSKTLIYPVFGIPESADQDRPIGKFYVQFNGNLCAYDLPDGAIAMSFNNPPAGAPPGFNGFVPFSDGTVTGAYLEGTFELTILEATGVYRAFQGGHNHMVDKLHHLANGSFDEFCFCNISTYPFP